MLRAPGGRREGVQVRANALLLRLRALGVEELLPLPLVPRGLRGAPQESP